MTTSAPNRHWSQSSLVLVLLCIMIYAMGVYSYASIRFKGRWNENDTMVLTRVIHFVKEDGSILYAERVYGNGLSFQAIAVFFMNVSGVDLTELQIFIFPLLTGTLPLIVFITYRAFLNNNLYALLATMMLFLQPDFLFVTWRGSHERFTWMLTLLSLYLLTRNLSAIRSNSERARFTGLFFVVMFALVCSNAFFATSYISAMLLACLVGASFLLIRFRIHRIPFVIMRSHVTSVFFAISACGVLMYLMFFYIYPPALSLLLAFRSLIDGLAALFLSTSESASAFDYVTAAWIDSRLFLLLTLFGWLVLLASVFGWLAGAYYFFRNIELPAVDNRRLFLWMIYPAFSVQLALAVVADRTGALGSNLQVRLFPPLIISAIPIAAITIMEILQKLRPAPVKWLAIGFLCVSVMFFSAASLFKLTNEPIVSNNWTFNMSSELDASEWLLARTEAPTIWSGLDGRIQTATVFNNPAVSPTYFVGGFDLPDEAKYYLISDLELARWVRQNLPLPYLDNEFLIYDNGSTRIYYRNPRTIFQW